LLDDGFKILAHNFARAGCFRRRWASALASRQHGAEHDQKMMRAIMGVSIARPNLRIAAVLHEDHAIRKHERNGVAPRHQFSMAVEEQVIAQAAVPIIRDPGLKFTVPSQMS